MGGVVRDHASFFATEKKEKIPDSERCLYLMKGNRHG